jgi:hypothetical protein
MAQKGAEAPKKEEEEWEKMRFFFLSKQSPGPV